MTVSNTGDATGLTDLLANLLDAGQALTADAVPDAAGKPAAFAALKSEYGALQRAWSTAAGWLDTPSDEPTTEMLRDELQVWAWTTVKGQLAQAAEDYLSAAEAA